ncbi:MAG: hypothetical protein QOH58_3321 [Thermoleophilaceae bacterium]|jgi:peptidoglycan hydrolase-like protein with peptidoglycan-binding domain/DNA invertase Pin-like site-specific DNA recombinase|nr:hypothetical protein [Thermoleophilaceae bacterium]
MRRTYELPFSRAGLAGLLAVLVLLWLPGTSIAGGVSDKTTGSEAGSGLLQYGAGYGKAEGGPAVRAVQRTLRRLGWQPGPVDGLYGPLTTAAVARFQNAARLAADGIVGRDTRRELTRAKERPLRRGAGYAQPDGSPQVRSLQAKLQRRGVQPGPVDGLFGPRTQAAVERLQRTGGLPATGVVTTRTRQVLAGNGKPQEQRASAPRNEEPVQSGAGQADTRPGVAVRVADTQVTKGESGDVAVPLVVLIGVLALLLGMLAGGLLGRRNKVVSGTAVPLAQGVVAEGRSNARSVGRFRGPVHALVLGRRGFRRAPEARYLVSDPAKEDPFWVSQDEVTNIVPPDRRRAQQRVGTDGGHVRVLGYVSVPETEELQGAQFAEQTSAIDSYCDQRGWELVEVVRDVEGSTDRGLERRGLLYALDKIGRGEANCLLVSELGRLSGSAADLGGILDRLGRSDGRLVAMDIGLDTASEGGHVAARALASVSSWEHDRARTGLAAAQAAAAPPAAQAAVADVPAIKERIVAMREEGMTLQAIADVLNSEGVPTLRGGAKWRPSSVQSAAGYRRPPKRQVE